MTTSGTTVLLRIIASALMLATAGCTLATQQDLLRLDDSLTKMRKTQADLVTKMLDLNNSLESLNSQLESSQQRMSSLSSKLDDLQADLSGRMQRLTGQVTGTSTPGTASPGDLYRLAYNDYQAGKFDLALVGFRNLVSQHAQAEQAPQAQFYIGECEFARKNWTEAAKEYQRVFQHYAKSDFAPKALYKRGLALMQAQRVDEARDSLQKLVKEFPRHELTKSARDILKETQ
jgi:tol-pal system protein YbgF